MNKKINCKNEKIETFMKDEKWCYYDEDTKKYKVKLGAPRKINDNFKNLNFDFDDNFYVQDLNREEIIEAIYDENIEYINELIIKPIDLVKDDSKMLWFELGKYVEDSYPDEEIGWNWDSSFESLKTICSELVSFVFLKFVNNKEELNNKLKFLEEETDFQKFNKKLLILIDELNKTIPYAYLNIYLFETPYNAKYVLDHHLQNLGIPFEIFDKYKTEFFMLDELLHALGE